MTSTSQAIRSILIVGGGTAGWLTASILAAKHSKDGPKADEPLNITLIEAPDIPIVGVGEGTWPSMRSTLHNAGIKESDFIRECDAAFKQGSKFVGWKNGTANDFYYHPYDLPQDFYATNLAQHWCDSFDGAEGSLSAAEGSLYGAEGSKKGPGAYESFSKMACVQEHLCEKDLSPKLKHSAQYAGVANYGYHLNAGKFSEFLKRHCVEQLGVTLVLDKVIEVVPNYAVNNSADYPDDINHVVTEKSGKLEADLFIDCTGFRSLLLGQHYGVGFIDKSLEFPINSALAVQVPYQDDEPVKSATISTAQEAGWVWDIGLSTRRGVGHVFSNNHTSESSALQALQAYLQMDNRAFDKLEPRSIAIKPGYRETFWHNNCVAVGLSAGFLEPLEASAMMLIETSASMISSVLPDSRAAMEIVASRFNRRHHYLWQRIIDFLQLHYHLSDRQDPFWRDAACGAHLSDQLKEDLELWQYQAPLAEEFTNLEEAFPSASYQYVLYGMGFKSRASSRTSATAQQAIAAVAHQAKLLTSKVESNRSILNLINS